MDISKVLKQQISVTEAFETGSDPLAFPGAHEEIDYSAKLKFSDDEGDEEGEEEPTESSNESRYENKFEFDM